jgi:hypothetical protein
MYSLLAKYPFSWSMMSGEVTENHKNDWALTAQSNVLKGSKIVLRYKSKDRLIPMGLAAQGRQ